MQARWRFQKNTENREGQLLWTLGNIVDCKERHKLAIKETKQMLIQKSGFIAPETPLQAPRYRQQQVAHCRAATVDDCVVNLF